MFELSVNRTRNHGYKLVPPRFNTVLYWDFPMVRVCKLWNSLPEAVLNAPSVERLKGGWTRSLGPLSVRFPKLTSLFSLLYRLWQFPLVIPSSSDGWVRLAFTAVHGWPCFSLEVYSSSSLDTKSLPFSFQNRSLLNDSSWPSAPFIYSWGGTPFFLKTGTGIGEVHLVSRAFLIGRWVYLGWPIPCWSA